MLALLALVALAFGLAACGSRQQQRQHHRLRTRAAATTTTPQRRLASVIQSNPDNAGKPTITIGSKNFTEEFILGEIYAQALQAAGYKVKKQLNLGSEQIALKALKAGSIDAYPEYTGTALTSFFKVKNDDVPKDAAAGLRADQGRVRQDRLHGAAADAVHGLQRLRDDPGGRAEGRQRDHAERPGLQGVMPRAIRRPKARTAPASSSSGSRSWDKGSDVVSTTPEETHVKAELDPGGDPPEDDRNEEVEGSPAPDPTEETDAGDDPQAD